MKKSEIKAIIKEVGGPGSMWDSEAQAKLGTAVANFKNAIVDADAMRIMKAYKDMAQYVDAYVEEIYYK